MLVFDPYRSFEPGSIGQQRRELVGYKNESVLPVSHHTLWSMGDHAYQQARVITPAEFDFRALLQPYWNFPLRVGQIINLMWDHFERDGRALESQLAQQISQWRCELPGAGEGWREDLRERLSDQIGKKYRFLRSLLASTGKPLLGTRIYSISEAIPEIDPKVAAGQPVSIEAGFDGFGAFTALLIEMNDLVLRYQRLKFDDICAAVLELAELEKLIYSASPAPSLQKIGNEAKQERARASANAMQIEAMDILIANPDLRTSEIGTIIFDRMKLDPSRYGLTSPVKKENVLKKIRPVMPESAKKRGPKAHRSQ